VDLVWDDNSDNEDEFQIERRLQGDPSFTQLAAVGTDVSEFPDDTVEVTKAYEYRIKACNEAGCSPASATAVITVPALKIFIGPLSLIPGPF
jgi:hypothetical protein